MTTLNTQTIEITMLMNIKKLILTCLLYLPLINCHATPDPVQLLVWANEAIIKTYSYTYSNYLPAQKETAQYFTSDGWIAYTKALNASKVPEEVQKNLYTVSAVATAPPVLNTVDATHWTVTMPVLVQYQNPQYQQQQNLNIVLGITLSSSGQGVRGFAITSFQSHAITPPCRCIPAAH